MLGFSLPVAMATNTLAGAMWTLVAARNYLRGHTVDWRLIAGMAACGLVGAFFGAQVVMHSDPKNMQKIIGVIILTLVVYTFFKKEFGLESKPPTTSRLLTSLAGFPLGFYESFFGSGNSLITSAILTQDPRAQASGSSGILVCHVFFSGVYSPHSCTDHEAIGNCR